MKPKLIIFDMDGLMFDTERIYFRAWSKIMSKHSYNFNFEIYKQLMARNSYDMEIVLKGIYGTDFPFQKINEERRKEGESIIQEEGVPHKKGLVTLLDYLENKGINKVVATSSVREKADRYLEKAGVLDRFTKIVCGSDVKQSKPNPEIFEKAADIFNASKDECIVLEDSQNGIRAAHFAGMKCIFVPDLVQSDDEIKEKSTIEIIDLEKVIDYIESLN